MKLKTTNLWILIAVAFVSVISLVGQLVYIKEFFNFFSCITSLIGILAFILFLRRNKGYSLLALVWAYFQLIIFTKYVPDMHNSQWIEFPLLNGTQLFNIKFGFNFIVSNEASYALQLNLFSFLYIGAAHIVYANSIVGRPIQLKPYKKDSFLSDFLPGEGMITDRLRFGNEKKWYLIELKDKDQKFILIKTKEGERLKPAKKNQIVLVNLVENSDKIKLSKRVDWAVLQ